MNYRKCFNLLSVPTMLVILSSPSPAQPPDTLWTATYGGSSIEYGYSVQQTSDGGYIITGNTGSYGAGYYDVYLIKTDSLGNQLWTQTFGGTSDDEGYSVQETTDGGYIISGYTLSYGAGYSDVYLIKTDISGNQLWSQTFGGGDWDEGWSVQQTQDGGYIITGNTSSYGAGYSDVYLIKTDASGNELWSHTFGGSSSDYGRGVEQTEDGGYIIAGYTSSYGAGGNDVWLIKTNANGDSLWSQTLGGSGYDIGNSVQQTQDEGYIIAGVTDSYGAGALDVYLIRTDVWGSQLWSQTFGGSSVDRGHSARQTQDDGYIVAGYTNSYGAGGSDVYLIKTDASGNELWSQTFGGSSAEYGYSVQQTEDGGYIITGYTNSYGAGDFDIWLIRLEGEAPPDLSVSLTPHNPPIQIPASGGSFQFDVAIENTTTAAILADAWIETTPPGGPVIPLMVRLDITFPANTTITRTDLTQNVPPQAPAGVYNYTCSVGEMMGAIIDFDQFTFEKLAGDGSVATVIPDLVRDWNLSGWYETPSGEDEAAPAEFSLHSAYPNPFNPTTAIRYQLSAPSFVNLAVYDVSGRKVAELVNGWREAGYHDVTFDGSNLASGVYFCHIEAGEFTAVRKMILMK